VELGFKGSVLGEGEILVLLAVEDVLADAKAEDLENIKVLHVSVVIVRGKLLSVNLLNAALNVQT